MYHGLVSLILVLLMMSTLIFQVLTWRLERRHKSEFSGWGRLSLLGKKVHYGWVHRNSSGDYWLADTTGTPQLIGQGAVYSLRAATFQEVANEAIQEVKDREVADAHLRDRVTELAEQKELYAKALRSIADDEKGEGLDPMAVAKKALYDGDDIPF